MPVLTAHLLGALEARGRDASGYAWRDDDAETWVVKRRLRGGLLAQRHAPRGQMTTGARAVLVHTRYATLGTPAIAANNHPIMRPGVVLVHNGHVSNHREITKNNRIARDAEVDSEVLAAIIEQSKSTATTLKGFGGIQGTAAVAWLEDGDQIGRLHAARLSGSPLVIGQTKAGDTIGCSTETLMRKALDQMGVKLDWVEHLKEGDYITVTDGVIDTYDHFTVLPVIYRKPDYTHASKWATPAATKTPGPDPYIEDLAEDEWWATHENDRRRELEAVFGTLTDEELHLFDDDWTTQDWR